MHSREYQRIPGRAEDVQSQPQRQEVQTGLNLFLDLKNPAQMPALLGMIHSQMDEVRSALQDLHYVHFARFLPARDGSSLLVITEFDGELKPYIMDFVAVLGDVFTGILQFVKDAPRLPVQNYPQDFWEFVNKNNFSEVQPWSAYKYSTVLDIQGARREVPSELPEPAPATLSLDDIQGNIVMGYNARFARHFALRITDPQRARQFIEALLPRADSRVHVSTAEMSAKPPEYLLTIGFTWRGLQALGVADNTLQLFPEAFRRGPAFVDRKTKIDISASLGDTGDSAPSNWLLGNPDKPETLPDLLLSLLTKKKQELKDRTRDLKVLIDQEQLLPLPLPFEPEALGAPNRHAVVHFGYRDGIAQPRFPVDGISRKTNIDDKQPAAATGDFLLGKDYQNTYGGNFAGDLPRELCDNGTYAAVRIMKQDVRAFEEFLDLAAERTGVRRTAVPSKRWQDRREWIAAKLMGRWRDGRPLSLAPTADVEISDAHLNDFDFAPAAPHPTYYDDFDGMRCPLSSHIRRLNPRGALVTGKPYSRRIIRRGMPYGPTFNPEQADDGAERGLFGIFICGDLEMQFEFLLSTWTNKDISTAGIRGMRDPIAGAKSEFGGKFVIRTSDEQDPIVLDVPHFVTTRGCGYCFMPGIRGLRYLSSLKT